MNPIAKKRSSQDVSLEEEEVKDTAEIPLKYVPMEEDIKDDDQSKARRN
jgi:hypothetical protein